MNDNKQMPEIRVPEDKQMGIYSNLCIVMHSPSEFIFDFARILPGQEQPTLAGRVLLTPDNAKRLAKMLMGNVQEYERNYGKIELPEEQIGTSPSNIKGEA